VTKARILIFTPADLLLPDGGNGVRAVLPSLDLALRRGAAVVLLWPGETPEAGRWAGEALNGSPFVAAPRPSWEARVRRLLAEEGGPVSIGVGSCPDDLGWLYATDHRYLAGEGEAPGVISIPRPFPVAWRMAVEEVVPLARP